MPLTQVDPVAALVVIDLQKGHFGVATVDLLAAPQRIFEIFYR